jgi:hypothetical protein
MSFSRGSKVRYQTPCCHVPAHHALILHQESYHCPACDGWGPWSRRVRLSMKKQQPPKPKQTWGQRVDALRTWWWHHHCTLFMGTQKLRRILINDNPDVVVKDHAGHRPTGWVVRRTFRFFVPSTWLVSDAECVRITYAWSRCSNLYRAYNAQGLTIPTSRG